MTNTVAPIADKKVKRKAADAAVADGGAKKKAKKTVVEGAPASPKSAASTPEPAQPAAVSDDAFRKAHDITVKGAPPGASALYQNFSDAPFTPQLQAALLAAGFKAPSPIQAQAWPLALTGRDILATARTGSGKTCGYLLPSIMRVLEQNPALAAAAAAGPNRGAGAPRPANGKGGPSILVMSPTRELAVQIQQQAAQFGKAAGLRSVAVYGGAPKGPQIRELHSGAQIVIATPGRMNDMLVFKCSDGSPVLSLKATGILVLDEADRMCDMGFEDDIKKIVAQMPSNKQTLFFTATWPKAVARVAASILRNPIQISIGSSDQLTANKDVKQVVEIMDNSSKFDKLMSIIKDEMKPDARVIIFCNRKHMCNDVEAGLWQAGHSVGAIHGDKTQQEREWALNQIRLGKMPILVATDVAARGLDIKGMDRVINYDFPKNTEDYIHRIGRTGRAGATGTANTFFTSADSKHAGELIKILRGANQEVPSSLEAMGQRGGGGGGKWGGGGGGGRWGGGGGGNKWGGGGGRRY